MNQFIFKSRWIAIAFATLTLFSVYAFVGGEGEGGIFGGVRDDLVDQAGQTEAQLAAISTVSDTPPVAEQPPEMMVEEEFVDDTELIDSATGEDPTPQDGGEIDAGDGGDGDSGDSYISDTPPELAGDEEGGFDE